MSDLNQYKVEIGGLPHTFQMTEEEASRLGAAPVKAEPAPQNKARGTRNKKA